MQILIESMQRASRDIDPDTLLTAVDWQDYADVLRSEVLSCQAQLADRRRRGEWRTRCMHAMQAYSEGLQRAKRRVHELKEAEREARIAELLGGAATPEAAAYRLRGVVLAWVEAGLVTPNGQERALLDYIRSFGYRSLHEDG